MKRKTAASIYREHELTKLRSLYKAVIRLTVDHKVIEDSAGETYAVVFPADLAKALELVNTNWIKERD